MNNAYSNFVKSIWAPHTLLMVRGERRRKESGSERPAFTMGRSLSPCQLRILTVLFLSPRVWSVNNEERRVRWLDFVHEDVIGVITQVDENREGNIVVRADQVHQFPNPLMGDAGLCLTDLGTPEASRETVDNKESLHALKELVYSRARELIEEAFRSKEELDEDHEWTRDLVHAARNVSSIEKGKFKASKDIEKLEKLLKDGPNRARTTFGERVRQALEQDTSELKLSRFSSFLQAIEKSFCEQHEKWMQDKKHTWMEPAQLAEFIKSVGDDISPTGWVESDWKKRDTLKKDIDKCRRLERKMYALIQGNPLLERDQSFAQATLGSSSAAKNPVEQEQQKQAEWSNFLSLAGPEFEPTNIRKHILDPGMHPPLFFFCRPARCWLQGRAVHPSWLQIDTAAAGLHQRARTPEPGCSMGELIHPELKLPFE